jgi:ABC-type microcin C transport system duplicated ATPase subunit YejF
MSFGESAKTVNMDKLLKYRTCSCGLGNRRVFARKVAEVRAVDGVSLDLNKGETLGLVGESGCGKSTVGRAIVNILRSQSYGVDISGKIIYHSLSGSVDLAPMSRSQMRPYRTDIQMIFQDPYSSLNPRMTVTQIVEEPLKIHTKDSQKERRERVAWLGKVGLTAEQANRYPHNFRRPAASHLRGRLRRIQRHRG